MQEEFAIFKREQAEFRERHPFPWRVTNELEDHYYLVDANGLSVDLEEAVKYSDWMQFKDPPRKPLETTIELSCDRFVVKE